ncbi:MAG: metallopeptidase TldD-related protein [Acidobacteriota bacterium]
MLPTRRADLEEFAASVKKAVPRDLDDLYVERVNEVRWRLRGTLAASQHTLTREGAAVRRGGRLSSADGLDGAVIASLLEVPRRGLADLDAPELPSAPTLDEVVAALGVADVDLRWRGVWSAVVRDGAVAEGGKPALLEIVHPDGLRQLTVWPPAPDLEVLPPASEAAAPRPGRTTVLFAPAAAAVLLHELFGHPLEADSLLRGASPWAGKFGQRVTPLALDLDDDPGAALPGAYVADDEGSPAGVRALLRAGELVGAIADRSAAPALGAAPGNARRATCHAPPRPRLSNLVVTAGGAEPPRAEARLEVTSAYSGTVEPRSGTLLLSVRSAWHLRGGERKGPAGAFTLSASVGAAAAGLVAAGGLARASAAPGWCGKNGETLPTGAVAPWLLVAGLEVR